MPQVPTHVHPNYAVNPSNGDHYTAYNKPFSVMHFLEHGKPLSKWICVIDADMVRVPSFASMPSEV